MEKEIIQRCANCGSTNIQVRAWVKPNQNNLFVDYISEGDEADDQWCDDCQDHVNLVISGKLPEDLDPLIENQLQESYQLYVCPECGEPLTCKDIEGDGEVEEGHYQCSNCDYVCSIDEYNSKIEKMAEVEFDNIKCKICTLFQYSETNDTEENSPFEPYKQDLIDEIINRNTKI